MPAGAILGVGLVSVIAIVHALHSPENGVTGTAGVLTQVATPLPASASSLDRHSASAILGGEPREEPVSTFADRFAFGGIEDPGKRTYSVAPDSMPPAAERFWLRAARPHHHSRHRRKATRHAPERTERAAGSHGWLDDFLHGSGFEPRIAERR